MRKSGLCSLLSCLSRSLWRSWTICLSKKLVISGWWVSFIHFVLTRPFLCENDASYHNGFLFTIYLSSLLSFRKFSFIIMPANFHTQRISLFIVCGLFMTIFFFFLFIRYLDASMKFVPQCSTALFNVFKAKCCRGFKRSKLRCLVGNRQEGKRWNAIVLCIDEMQ